MAVVERWLFIEVPLYVSLRLQVIKIWVLKELGIVGRLSYFIFKFKRKILITLYRLRQTVQTRKWRLY